MIQLDPLVGGFPNKAGGLGEGGELAGGAGGALHTAEPDGGGQRSETLIRVVLAEEKAVFRPAREHAIRLGAALGHQVIDHHPKIGRVPVEDQGLSAQELECGVCASQKALPCGFLVAGRSIDLPREVKALHPFGFEGGGELGRGAVVVLHRIARADNLGALETRNTPNEGELDLIGKGGGDAIHVVLVGVTAFWFQKDLVALFLSKPDHLVLDGRAVARPHPFDLSRIHGALVQIIADVLMSLWISPGDPTGTLFHVESFVSPRI